MHGYVVYAKDKNGNVTVSYIYICMTIEAVPNYCTVAIVYIYYVLFPHGLYSLLDLFNKLTYLLTYYVNIAMDMHNYDNTPMQYNCEF